MFTGIVEGTGIVTDVTDEADGLRLRIAADLDGLEHGQSISVSGACLTVERHGGDPPADRESWFEVFLAEETVDRTYLGGLEPGDRVNVERALRADQRLDGHFVQGHVDATAEVAGVERVGEDWRYDFSVPEGTGGYLVEKGSVAVDGISLTVADVSEGRFSVAVIPTTHELTTLSEKGVGDPVHLEVDVVAKYVESLLEGAAYGES